MEDSIDSGIGQHILGPVASLRFLRLQLVEVLGVGAWFVVVFDASPPRYSGGRVRPMPPCCWVMAATIGGGLSWFAKTLVDSPSLKVTPPAAALFSEPPPSAVTAGASQDAVEYGI